MSHLSTRFFERAPEWGDRVALRFMDEQITYKQWLQGSQSICNFLIQKGFQGRNIGVMLPNIPSFPIAFFGVLHSGNTLVPINPNLQKKEILNIVQHSDMQLLLTEPQWSEQLNQYEELQQKGFEVIEISEILRSSSQGTPSLVDLNPDSIAVLLYTSGTTGDPKGVMLSHRNILSNCDAYNRVYRFTPEDHVVGVLPLFHTFGITTNLLASAYRGCPLSLVSKFQPRQVLDILKSVSRGVFTAVPSMFNLLSKIPGTEQLNNIRIIVSGASALPGKVQEAFEKRFNIEILEGYGLTEASPVVSGNIQGRNKPGSIGLPLPGLKVQVWDDEDQPLPPNQRGELVIKGPSVMAGYYKNEAATEATITPEGWLRTGDIATLDEEGYIRIVGRKKELIVSSGENIYPRDIEDVIQTFPNVFEVAVIPAPDPLRGEVPKAVIVPMEGEILDLNQLRKYCQEQLADFKVPRFFEILPALPKTPTGKIDKKVLIGNS